MMLWLLSGTNFAEVGCHVLLKAKTHYLVFLYQCLQHSRALRMLHCALMINMPRHTLSLSSHRICCLLDGFCTSQQKAGQASRRQQFQQNVQLN